MPFPLQALILWLHLLAAITWIGGLVFQVLVVFPTLARATPTGERLRFALSLEARFRVILWPAVGLVLFTGLVNLMNVWYASVVTAESISPTFVGLLSVKLGIVIGMIALQTVQQLLIYPRRVAALRRSLYLEHPEAVGAVPALAPALGITVLFGVVGLLAAVYTARQQAL